MGCLGIVQGLSRDGSWVVQRWFRSCSGIFHGLFRGCLGAVHGLFSGLSGMVHSLSWVIQMLLMGCSECGSWIAQGLLRDGF